jgi:hypothetical protein
MLVVDYLYPKSTISNVTSCSHDPIKLLPSHTHELDGKLDQVALSKCVDCQTALQQIKSLESTIPISEWCEECMMRTCRDCISGHTNHKFSRRQYNDIEWNVKQKSLPESQSRIKREVTIQEGDRIFTINADVDETILDIKTRIENEIIEDSFSSSTKKQAGILIRVFDGNKVEDLRLVKR